ncbi:MAG: cysteine synthase A [Spirochaetales bacterium]|nr:cysteine synthase A [Spirochaetales bacterium]
MKIHQSVLALIGHTPLVELRHPRSDTGGTILGKLECFNPSGSVKDRTALGMIEDAEERGALSPGTLIVEPTSGNTGIGLAMIAAVKGYSLVLTMPDSVSVERRAILKGFGADLVLTPGEKGMKGAIEEARRIAGDRPPSFLPMQFANPANPLMHYRTTGKEIWEDTEGRVDIFVAGVGTGGTLTGVGRFLKERRNTVRLVAVEPAASPVLSGGTAGKHAIQGIGAGFVPDILDRTLIDEILPVTDEEALKASRTLMREQGIMAGISSGAAFHAACVLAGRKENTGKTVVVLLPDTGERYLSTSLFKI